MVVFLIISLTSSSQRKQLSHHSVIIIISCSPHNESDEPQNICHLCFFISYRWLFVADGIMATSGKKRKYQGFQSHLLYVKPIMDASPPRPVPPGPPTDGPALSQTPVSLRPRVLLIHKHWLRLSVAQTTRLGRGPSFCSCYIIHAYLTGAISGLDSTSSLLNRQHFFGASAYKAEFRHGYRLTLKNLASFSCRYFTYTFKSSFLPADLDTKI